MSDEAVTLPQVLWTAAFGAAFGAAIGGLACLGSPYARGLFPWSVVVPAGFVACVFLWIRYAPWWLDWHDLTFWR